MKKHFINLAKKRIPPLINILFYRLGFRPTLLATVRFACVGVLLAAAFFAVQSVAHVSVAVISVVVGMALFWRLKEFDILGRILLASAILQENISQIQRARSRFLAALHFLKDRQKVYEGLSRIATSKDDECQLARIIRTSEKKLSAAQSLIVARGLHLSGDHEAARGFYELADQLGSAGAAKLELARLFLDANRPTECLRTLEGLGQSANNDSYYFLKASALRTLSRHEEAFHAVNCAIRLRPCNSEYHSEKGKILEGLGRHRSAIRQYAKAIYVHPRNPDAHFRRGVLRLMERSTEAGIRDLEQSYYFQNTRTEAFLLRESAKLQSESCLSEFKWKKRPSWLTVHQPTCALQKGDTTSVKVTIRPDVSIESCRVTALEPFGGGLEVKPREIATERIEAGQCHEVIFHVTVKRSIEVNMGHPWVLNLVMTANHFWANLLLEFQVRDTAKGRVFLLVTEDHESRLHRDQMVTGRKAISKPHEVELDLVEKSREANALAEKYGIKWTHMLDAGTAIGLPVWAGKRSNAWRQLSNRVQEYYKSAYVRGHDCQLHLHLSGVPESYFFCYNYDSHNDEVSFDLDKKDSVFPGWQINSWANVVGKYGRPKDVNSRLGSIAHTKKLVGGVLMEDFPAYQPVFFRAGQWDLGANTAEREKSILALRKNGILADSSLTEGYSYYQPGFSFGKPVHKAAFFTSRNNPEQAAKQLVDAGILEVVPIPMMQGRHAVTPRDNANAVVKAYQACHQNGAVKPGRHIIMEIEHISSIRDEKQVSGGLSAGNGDWVSMANHFATIRRNCRDLEAPGASTAIYAWLDYYSPELIVRLGPPGQGPDAGADHITLSFPLEFLGEGILCDEARRYEVSVPLPQTGDRTIDAVRICGSNAPVFETSECRGCAVGAELLLSTRNAHSFTLEITLA
jgi:tetratricopeptide (TPR) repeat protein